MSWKTLNDKERTKPKFVKAGTILMIDARVAPKLDPKVKGRYGTREMYIVETRELGKVYVTPNQFLHINMVLQAAFGDKPYDDFVSVEI